MFNDISLGTLLFEGPPTSWKAERDPKAQIKVPMGKGEILKNHL